MTDPLMSALERLVESVPAPNRRVRQATAVWHAEVWDSAVVLDVEFDPREGIFVLLASVDVDGYPSTGPYLNSEGERVRAHAAQLLEGTDPELVGRMRQVLSGWPTYDLVDGDWEGLQEVCSELWTAVQDKGFASIGSWTDWER